MESRERPISGRVIAKVAIFFAGGGTWLAGVAVGDERLTAAGLALLAVGVLLRLYWSGRREGEPE